MSNLPVFENLDMALVDGTKAKQAVDLDLAAVLFSALSYMAEANAKAIDAVINSDIAAVRRELLYSADVVNAAMASIKRNIYKEVPADG